MFLFKYMQEERGGYRNDMDYPHDMYNYRMNRRKSLDRYAMRPGEYTQNTLHKKGFRRKAGYKGRTSDGQAGDRLVNLSARLYVFTTLYIRHFEITKIKLGKILDLVYRDRCFCVDLSDSLMV